MLKKGILLILGIPILYLASGCNNHTRQESPTKKINIFVTVIPMMGIVKAIGSDDVEVNALVKTGSCPETFSPTTKQIKSLAEADVFMSLGLPFEEIWINKISNSKMKIMPMTAGIDFRGKGDKDPHVWMSLRNSVKMAINVTKILSELMPEKAKYFQKNLEAFSNKAEKLDGVLKKKFNATTNKNIFVYHPVFGYFADDYDLKQIPIEIEGKEPSAKQLVALVKTFKKYNTQLIFVQPEFSPKAAEAVAKELNAAIVPVSIYGEDIFKTVEDLVKQWK